MESRLDINIAILGPVSAGKSTLLNALFVEKYSDMKMKRTTMLPQVYQETDDKIRTKNATIINQENTKINKEIIEKTENNLKLELKDCQEMFHYVDKIYDFHKLEKDIYINIYDIPGLNDARTADIYFQYLDSSFYKFDIIILMTDINSGLNTSDETKIIDKVTDYIKREIDKSKKIYMITCVNKCDNMEYNHGKLEILDEEFQEQYAQVIKTITDIAKKKNIYEYCNSITPISMEDAYIYRLCKCEKSPKLDKKHIEKLGINEYGKNKWNKMKDKEKADKKLIDDINKSYTSNMETCGFKNFQDQLNKIFKNNQYNMLINHLVNDIKKITLLETVIDITSCINTNIILSIIDEYIIVFSKHKRINNIFKKKSNLKYLDDIILNNCQQLFAKILEITNKPINYSNEYSNNTNIKKILVYLESKIDQINCLKDISKKITELIIMINERANNYIINNISLCQEIEDLYTNICNLKYNECAIEKIKEILISGIKKINIGNTNYSKNNNIITFFKNIFINITEDRNFIIDLIFKYLMTRLMYTRIKNVAYSNDLLYVSYLLEYLNRKMNTFENRKLYVNEYRMLYIVANITFNDIHYNIRKANDSKSFFSEENDNMFQQYDSGYHLLIIEDYLDTLISESIKTNNELIVFSDVDSEECKKNKKLHIGDKLEVISDDDDIIDDDEINNSSNNIYEEKDDEQDIIKDKTNGDVNTKLKKNNAFDKCIL